MKTACYACLYLGVNSIDVEQTCHEGTQNFYAVKCAVILLRHLFLKLVG